MSGGSLDYIFYQLQGIVEASRSNDKDSHRIRINTAFRQEFITLLELIAKALEKIELVDSGDYGTFDDSEAIYNVFRFAYNSFEQDCWDNEDYLIDEPNPTVHDLEPDGLYQAHDDDGKPIGLPQGGACWKECCKWDEQKNFKKVY